MERAGDPEIMVPSDEIHSRLIFEGEHHSVILLDVQELELECRG
jgi:bifunctional pyridoxal-dependent enzyme with beta-cystathionase and maltose regulon repressor activities